MCYLSCAYGLAPRRNDGHRLWCGARSSWCWRETRGHQLPGASLEGLKSEHCLTPRGRRGRRAGPLWALRALGCLQLVDRGRETSVALLTLFRSNWDDSSSPCSVPCLHAPSCTLLSLDKVLSSPSRLLVPFVGRLVLRVVCVVCVALCVSGSHGLSLLHLEIRPWLARPCGGLPARSLPACRRLRLVSAANKRDATWRGEHARARRQALVGQAGEAHHQRARRLWADGHKRRGPLGTERRREAAQRAASERRLTSHRAPPRFSSRDGDDRQRRRQGRLDIVFDQVRLD